MVTERTLRLLARFNPLSLVMVALNIGAAVYEARRGNGRMAGVYLCYACSGFLLAGLKG